MNVEETKFIDAQMRQFIDNFKNDKIKPIDYKVIREQMPHTRLSIEENRQLDQITDWKFSGQYQTKLGEFDPIGFFTSIFSKSDLDKELEESIGKENL